MKTVITFVIFFALLMGASSCGVKPPQGVSQEERDNLENSYKNFQGEYNREVKEKKKKD